MNLLTISVFWGEKKQENLIVKVIRKNRYLFPIRHQIKYRDLFLS